MTADALKDIKALAKRVARASRIQHIAALDAVAVELEQSHWRGLMEAAKKGWSPTPEQLANLRRVFLVPGLTEQTGHTSEWGARRWSILQPMVAGRQYATGGQ
ncbi:hypothetical protein WHT83_05635 [Aminobacter sp. P9b]|uniref:hypothetical protein n=1 Tax=Aminobacter sp. P9b TaxID=3133697 RepID=UPI003247A935